MRLVARTDGSNPRKPIRPTADEVAANPRSRSARLRVAERI
ncbi:MAG: 16S rRNA (cytosine(1402)-N(4))-methyltransferase [Anaerolineae bacterium]